MEHKRRIDTVNANANAHIVSHSSTEKQTTRGQHVQIGESESHLYPRCEYRTRFKETSIFEMSDPKYWQTYFRCSNDRLAREHRKKFGKNKNVEDKATNPLKTGCMEHPFEIYSDKYKWQNETSKKAGGTSQDMKTEAVNDKNFYLYDDLLDYKCSMCKLVVEKFKEFGKEKYSIDVYFKNDYPCVMVQVKKFEELKSDSSKCYMIIGAYLTAIACYKAKQMGIPIELVNRASFGHNIPSVAETHTSLRISIGIIPKVYAEEVLVESLLTLDKLLPDLLQKKIYRSKFYYQLKEIRKNIGAYNRNIDSYNEKKFSERKKKTKRKVFYHYDTVFDLFDARDVAFHIALRKSNIDLLTDKILLHMNKNGEKDFHISLKETLEQLYGNTDVFPKNISYKKEKKYVFKETNQSIETDESFWEIVGKIESVLGQKNSESLLSNAVEARKLLGLYSALEKANVDFIQSCNVEHVELQSKEGYGSDSDSEIQFECTTEFRNNNSWKTLYSKKLIVSTGMRAIYVAHCASIYLNAMKKIDENNIDTEYTYYETGGAVKNIYRNINEKLENERKECNRKIRYIDLNHCTASGPDTKDVLRHLRKIQKEMIENFVQNGEKLKVIVFDCTSATTRKIRQTIRLFAQYVEVLLLVNSGIKNEQIGADMNPYGTIRMISEDKIKIDWLDYAIRLGLGTEETLSYESHCVRRYYKSVGAVITTKDICNAFGWNYVRYNKSEKKIRSGDFEQYDYHETIEKFFKFCFSDIYKDEIENLYADEIENYDINKIKTLGVPFALFIRANCDLDGNYKNHPEKTREILERLYEYRMIEDSLRKVGENSYTYDIPWLSDRLWNWNDKKIDDLLSKIGKTFIARGGNFIELEKCYDKKAERTLEILDRIDCKLKTFEKITRGRKLIPMNALHWKNKKIDDLISENVWQIYGEIGNSDKIELCDTDSKKTFEIRNRLINNGVLALAKYMNVDVLEWTEQKMEDLFSKDINQIIKNGEDFHEIGKLYDNNSKLLLEIIKLLKDAGFLSINKPINLGILSGWESQKRSYLLSDNVRKLIENDCDFQEIERSYDANRDLTLEIINKLCDEGNPKQQLDFFCDQIEKINKNGWDRYHTDEECCYDKMPNWARNIIERLHKQNCLEFGLYMFRKIPSVFFWNDKKIDDLFSEIVFHVCKNGENFHKIVKFYNAKPNRALEIINRLYNADCSKLVECVDDHVWDWDDKKLYDLFSKKLEQFVEDIHNFRKVIIMEKLDFITIDCFKRLEICYDKDSERTFKIIDRFKDKNWTKLKPYLDVDVMDWDEKKEHYLFSDEVNETVECGCPFSNIVRYYDTEPVWTHKMINNLKEHNCLKFGKYIFHDTPSIFFWDDQKAKFFFSENVRKLVEKGANLYEIEIFYDEDSEKTLKIINQLCDLRCSAVVKYVDARVIDWDDKKIRDLFSEDVSQIVENGGRFDKIESCYDKNPESIHKMMKDCYMYENSFREDESGVSDVYEIKKKCNDLDDSDDSDDSDDEIILENVDRIKVVGSKEASYIHKCNIEKCYDDYPDKTRKIINQLKDGDCPELGKYVDVDVLSWDNKKIEDLFSNDVWQIVENGGSFHTIKLCYNRNPERILYIIDRLKKEDCFELGSNIYNLDVLTWADQKIEDLFSQNVGQIVKNGGSFHNIKILYDVNPARILYIIDRLKNEDCFGLGRNIYNLDVLSWTDQKIEDLFSKNVWHIVRYGNSFHEIEISYDVKPVETIETIEQLCNMDCPNSKKYKNVDFLDWNDKKTWDLLAENVWQVIENGGDPLKIEKCYNEDSEKTLKIIDRLIKEECLAFAKYINVDVLRWSEEKTNDLFSGHVIKIVENGCDFDDIVRCYDAKPDWTHKIIEHLKKNYCLALAKYIFYNTSFVVHWNDQKISELFSENVRQFVENGGNFYDIEICYNRNPERILYIIDRLKKEGCFELGSNIYNLDVLTWADQKIEDLFSQNVWQIVKNGGSFHNIKILYDENPERILYIIDRLKNEDCFELGVNINLDVLNWNDQKIKKIFSKSAG